MTATKYLDLDGLARFKNKCDATYRTEAQVDGQINTALSTAFTNYKQAVIEIKTAVPTVSEAESGIIYLVIDSDADTPDIYTAYALETVDVSGTPTPTIVQLGTGRYTPALDDYPTENSEHSVKSSGVFEKLGEKVDSADVVSSVNDGDTTKIPTSDAVYQFVNDTFTSTVDTITNPEIDVMFMPAGEIWLSSEWAAMDVKTESAGTAVALNKNSSGYFVFDPSELTSADTLVFTDTSTASTAYTGISQLSDITALEGKIIGVADGDEEPNVLA